VGRQEGRQAEELTGTQVARLEVRQTGWHTGWHGLRGLQNRDHSMHIKEKMCTVGALFALVDFTHVYHQLKTKKLEYFK